MKAKIKAAKARNLERKAKLLEIVCIIQVAGRGGMAILHQNKAMQS